jgi:hypothetical protein
VSIHHFASLNILPVDRQLLRRAAIRKVEQDISDLSRQITDKLRAAQLASEKVRLAKQRGVRLSQLSAAVDIERKALDRGILSSYLK